MLYKLIILALIFLHNINEIKVEQIYNAEIIEALVYMVKQQEETTRKISGKFVENDNEILNLNNKVKELELKVKNLIDSVILNKANHTTESIPEVPNDTIKKDTEITSSGSIKSLAAFHDDTFLIGSSDRSVKKWEANRTYPLGSNTDFFECLTVLKEKVYASCDKKGSIIIRNSNPKQFVKEITIKNIISLLFLKDGTLVGGSYDQKIIFWTPISYNPKELATNDGPIYSLAELNDNKLVTGSEKLITIWDLTLNKRIKSFSGHKNSVKALAVLKNRFIISGSSYGRVIIWDTSNKNPNKIMEFKSVNALVILNDDQIAIGTDDEKIQIWDHINDEVKELEGHKERVNALIVLKDGRLVSGSDDKKIIIWK